MSSTRLPGKTLMDLGGITLIESVYRGAMSSSTLTDVVVSIPSSSTDDILFEFLESKRIPVSRGLEDNLIARHLQVAEEMSSDVLVRIPGDNPLPHGREIDRIVEFHLASNSGGFSTNLSQILDSGYPDGIGAEVFSVESLINAYESPHSTMQEEHVHLNFFDYEAACVVAPEQFPVKTVYCPREFALPSLILDINELEDLEYFRRMFRDLGTNQPDIEQIIPWHDRIGLGIRKRR